MDRREQARGPLYHLNEAYLCHNSNHVARAILSAMTECIDESRAMINRRDRLKLFRRKDLEGEQ